MSSVFCARVDSKTMELRVTAGEQTHRQVMPALFREGAESWDAPYESVRNRLRQHVEKHGVPAWVAAAL